jgi:membrane-bound ClpP family serine protease
MPLELIIVIALISIGIIFLLVEIFLLPGINIAGIAGAVFMIGGIVCAYIFLGSTAGNIALVTSAAALGGSFFWLIKSKTLRKIALKTDIDSTVDNSYLQKVKVGDKGISLSRLSPIVKARFHDITVEAKSLNDFIDEETPLIIVSVEGYNVIVDKI